MTLQELKAEAGQLSLQDRAELAHALLETLEQPSKEEIAALWVEEAEKRLDTVDAGTLNIVLGNEARQRLDDALP